VLLVVAIVLVVVLVVPATFAFVVWRRIGRVHVHLPGSSAGGTTYLLVGTDSRAGITSAADRASFGDSSQSPNENADLVLLLRVPDDGGRPRLLSVPRDLLVFIGPTAVGRLGPTLAHGPQALADSICRTLGIGVDHLVKIDFLSFVHLVDLVGGVDVTIPRPERDTVLSFEYGAGRHHLDGRAALTYVRVRHLEELRDGAWQPEAASALGRGERAREVLSQVAADAPSVSDPVGFSQFAWAVSGAVAVDQGTGVGDVRQLRDALHDLGRARELRLPVTFQDGVVPLAKLLPGSATVIRRFQPHAATGPCADASMPLDSGGILRLTR
jgi:LCP family protein required for cell wall assembly